MKGGIGWNLSILGVDRNPQEFYLMFLSREIDIKLYVNWHKGSRYSMTYRSKLDKKGVIMNISNFAQYINF